MHACRSTLEDPTEYWAEYSGEPALPEPAIWYDASTSFVEATTINEAPVSITWVGAPPTPRDGQAFDLRVLVQRAPYAGPGPVPTGFVTFYENGVPTGVQGVALDGTSTNTVGGRPEGLYDYTVQYNGSFDPQYAASGVIQRDITVLPAGLGQQLETTTIMSPCCGATFPYGVDMPITVFVTNTNGVPNARPTGNVDIYRSDDDGGSWTLVDTEPLVDIDPPNPGDPSPAGWVYWSETEDLAPGTYDYYADYEGEPVPADVDTSWFDPSTSSPVNAPNGMTVAYGSTSTVTPTASSYPEGQNVVLDVRVDSNPLGGDFQEGEAELYRDGVLIQTLPLTEGQVQFQDGGVPAGPHDYRVEFAPSTFAQYPSVSPTVGVTVLGETQISLSSDVEVAPEGSTFTLIPTVTSGGNPVTSGTIRYYNALGQYIADRPIASPELAVVPPIGLHRYTIDYFGFGAFPDATSLPHTLTVTGALPSDVELSWPEGLTYGDDIELTAEVVDLDVIPNGVREGPTGTVEFFDGVYGSLGTATIVFIPAEDEGPGRYLATLTVTRDLPPGERQIWAVYNGEASHPTGFPYAATGTPALTLPVQSGTVDLQLQVTRTELEGEDGGECVTLLATVTPTVGSAPVDGTVTYSVDGTDGSPPGDDEPQCTRVVPPVGGPVASALSIGGADAGGAWTSAPVPTGTPFTTWVEDGPHDFGASFGGDSGYQALSVSSPTTIGDPPVDPPVDPPPPPPVDPNDPGVLPVLLPDGPSTPSGTPGGAAETDVPVDARLALATDGSALDTSAPDQGPTVDLADPAVVAGLIVPKDEDSIRSPFDITRSSLVSSIPTRGDISWSAAALAGAVWLALLLILLVELPSTIVNATIEDHHDRVMAPFAGVIGLAQRADAVVAGWPTALVVLLFAGISGLIGAQLDPTFGLDATSLVLLAALIGSFAITTVVLEVARLPYLQARTGLGGRLKLFPFVLVVAVVAVVVCRIFDFQPGYVFGVSVALLLADGIDEEDEARSLALAGVGLIVVAVVAWFLWQPVAERAGGIDPSVATIFFDALLATTWVMCLQLVLFEFSSLRGMHGKTLRAWSKKTWAAIYFIAVFLLVKMVLHPSAWSWGGLETGTFIGMIALFVVLFLASLVFWAWFNLRAAPDDDTPHDLDDDRRTEDGLVS